MHLILLIIKRLIVNNLLAAIHLWRRSKHYWIEFIATVTGYVPMDRPARSFLAICTSCMFSYIEAVAYMWVSLLYILLGLVGLFGSYVFDVLRAMCLLLDCVSFSRDHSRFVSRILTENRQSWTVLAQINDTYIRRLNLFF